MTGVKNRERSAALPHGMQGAADSSFACTVRAFSQLFPGRRFGGGALAVYLHGDGLTELWDTVLKHRQALTDAGEFDARRRAQQVDWTWSMVRDTVLDRVLSNPEVKRIRAELERQVRDGELTPALAAQQILDAADG